MLCISKVFLQAKESFTSKIKKCTVLWPFIVMLQMFWFNLIPERSKATPSPCGLCYFQKPRIPHLFILIFIACIFHSLSFVLLTMLLLSWRTLVSAWYPMFFHSLVKHFEFHFGLFAVLLVLLCCINKVWLIDWSATHFTPWPASSAEVRKECGFELLALAHSSFACFTTISVIWATECNTMNVLQRRNCVLFSSYFKVVTSSPLKQLTTFNLINHMLGFLTEAFCKH